MERQMSDLERRSLQLMPDDWQRLEQLAAEFGTTPPSGPTAGTPSWRSLVKEIARGDLVISRPDNLKPSSKSSA